MKNLKKILSLALALAMALSLMTTAFAADASDFADYDDVAYAEAIDVMVAAGVFNGATGNKFDPSGTLTREQAAKIITYMMLGQTQADKLVTAIAPYSDVAADRWSAGSIAYCTNEGIIAGTGNGKFEPTRTLTGLEFAKMLLVALGYDPAIEKLEGSAWAINTATMAYAIDLDDGLESVILSAPMTREQAAQMAFTTMKTPLVEYVDKGGTISVNGAVIEFGAQKASYVTSEKTDGTDNATKIDDATLGNDSGRYLIEFGERYCPDLEKVSDENRLGQPAHKWTYKDKDIGSYADDENKVVAVDAKDKTLEDIIFGKSYMNYSTSKVTAETLDVDTTAANPCEIYVNGQVKSSVVGAFNDTLAAVALNKGDVVYTYANSAGEVTRIVVAQYTLAKIDEVTDKVTNSEKENGAAYRVKLVDLDGNDVGKGTYYDDHNTSDKVLKGFASGTYTEDAILAIALQAGTFRIADSYVAEVVTGKPTAVKEGHNGNITMDGTKYQFIADNATQAAIDGGSALVPDGTIRNFDFDKEYNVYLTKENYVIGIDGASAADLSDIYFVTTIYNEISGGETVYYAQRVSIDGEYETVKVEEGSLKAIAASATLTTSTGSATTTAAGNDAKGLYVFSDKKVDRAAYPDDKANDGVYTIARFTGSDADDDFDATGAGTLTNDLKATDTRMVTSNGTFYMNADTKYLGVEKYGSKISVSTAVGGVKVSNGTNVIVITEEDDSKTAVAVIFFDSSNLSMSTAAKDVVYMKGVSKDRAGADTFNATLWFMDNDSQDESVTITDDLNQRGFFTYELKDGVYKLIDEADRLAGGASLTYDDETGYAIDLVINSVYDKKGVSYLTADALAVNVNTLTVSDVKLNNVKIVDNRDDIDDGIYEYEITSTNDLKNALKVGLVHADVYFDDGVTFISVKEMEAGTQYAPNDPAVATVIALQDLLDDGENVIINGNYTLTGALTVGNTATSGTLTIKGNVTGSAAITVDNGDTLKITGTVANNVIVTDGTVQAGNIGGDLTVTDGTATTGNVTGSVTVTKGTATVEEITGTVAVATEGILNADAVKGALTVTGAGIVNAGSIEDNLDVSGATAGSVVTTGALDWANKTITSSGSAGKVVLTGSDAIADIGTQTLGGTWEIKANTTVTTGKTLTLDSGADVTFKGTLTVTDANGVAIPADGTLTLTAAQATASLENITGSAAGATLIVGAVSSDATLNKNLTASNTAKFFATAGTLSQDGSSNDGTAATTNIDDSDKIKAGTYRWTADIVAGTADNANVTAGNGATAWLVQS